MKFTIHSKESGLTSAETEILKMVQQRHGKRYHRSVECYINANGEKLIFIKNRKGEALFPVNLTLLAQIRTIFTTQLQEKYLAADSASKMLPVIPGQEPILEYYKFISEQLEAVSSPLLECLAS